jgi:Alpha amylase, catalytic domain
VVKEMVAMAVLVVASAQGDTAAVQGRWSIDGGWLVREGVAQRDTSDAANVLIADKGWVVAPSDSPEVTPSTETGVIEVVYTTKLGLLRDRYEPFPELGPHALRRSLVYRNTTEETQDMMRSVMRAAPAVIQDGNAWSPRFFRMTEVADGLALCVANWSEEDPHWFEVEPGRRAVTSAFSSRWRLQPGQEATVHHQGIWLAEANGEGFRHAARRWYEAHSFVEPLVYPEWLTRGVLYETCAGGHVEARFSDVGGFDPLAHQVDYLADLGVSAFWLNAVHEHKSPPDPVQGGWNLYDPRDLSRVDPILGGMEGLKRLAERMRAAGVHFISEAVPHGGRSVQAAALEAWWTRERDGSPAEPWGGYGMDNASPEWQKVQEGWMALLAVEVGIEGARIDVADGQGSNWGSPRTNHASFSTIGGGIEMLRAIRDGIAQGPAKRPVLIPESPLRAEYFAVPDAAMVGYGFETTSLFSDRLPSDLSDAAGINEVLQSHFEHERGSLPPGALTLRTLNNHDTVVSHGRVQVRYGAGLARALYSVCLSLPGIPMMYQEEEVGSFDALRRLNWARRRIPELATGEPTYLPASFFAPEVFSVLRSTVDGHALCLVNLSGHAVAATGAMREYLGDKAVLFDAVSEQQTSLRDGVLAWTLEPYAAAFFRVGKPPEGDVPPLRFAGEAPATEAESAAFTHEVTPRGITVRLGTLEVEFFAKGVEWRVETGADKTVKLRSDLGVVQLHGGDGKLAMSCQMKPDAAGHPPTLRVRNARQWYVSGRTAVLADNVLKRRAPFPPSTGYAWNRTQGWGARYWSALYNQVMPSGRLWQSLLEPLHPGEPAVAFEDAGGKALAITAIQTDAMNVVLTDCSDESGTGPFGLELRFMAVDPDLHPSVQRFGLGQPWKVDGLEPVTARPLALAFEIAPLAGNSAGCMTAARLPVIPRGVQATREGPDFSEGFSAIWTRQPGRLIWRGLAPVDGSFHIEFELRHSEAGPEGTDLVDAYRVEIDGREQPLEWVKYDTAHTGNAYFGRARTEPIDLSGQKHTISITTSKPWCAIRKGFSLRRPD